MELQEKTPLQVNKITGLAYQGRNQGELYEAKLKNGFKSNEWVTFLQAQELKLRIKKGSKSVAVFKGFARGEEVEKQKDGTQKVVRVSGPLGFARVFNLDQTEPYIIN